MALPERIVFVTGNAGKLRELRALLAPHGVAVDQDDRGYPEIQADRLADVAAAGAQHLLGDGLEPPFVLEDAGLFVTALRGFPGVYSRHALDTIGCAGLLRLLEGVEAETRTARFQAHLAFVDDEGRLHGFEGRARGRIAERARGDGGFGFDPVFEPDGGGGRTFAELSDEEKGRLSHRGVAARAFATWLSNQ